MDLETLVEQGTAVNLVAASCMTCILYDHFITLDQEVDRMWPARMSVAKTLFLLNRYLVQAMLIFNCICIIFPHRVRHATNKIEKPPPGHIFLQDCVFYLRWLVVTLTVTGAIVQGILVLRVWALHRNNKIAKGIAYFFYASGTATLVGLVIIDYINEDVLINKALNSLPGCYATSVPSIIAGFWIVPLVVESVLFMLVISRAFVWWKNGSSAPRILSLLARDSTVYFTVIFALLVANFLVFQVGPPFLSSLLVQPSTTAGCILGSHMLLNLRALSDPMEEEYGISMHSLRFPLPRRNPGSVSISVDVETRRHFFR